MENTLTIQEFADLIEEQTIKGNKYDYPGWEDYCRTHVKPGKKYTKIDQGTSGKLMIDEDGNIYGIKAYGVINRVRQYGTLATTHLYYWGDYTPVLRYVEGK